MKEVTMCCTTCPQGCALIASIDDQGKFESVSGNGCPRGAAFAKTEWENPVRMLTSTVYAELNGQSKLIPVKTKEPISKKLITKAMEEIKEVKVENAVKMGDVIIEDIAGSHISLIACKDVC